jgi:hypothetical protein
MKTIWGCIASFIILMFVFTCSGEKEKSFEKTEDFESGELGTLFRPGAYGTTVWIVDQPEKMSTSELKRVFSGKYSADSKADPFRGEWWEVAFADRVISGKYSAYSKAEPFRMEWWEFLYSDRKGLPLDRKGSYTVTFKYKAVEPPSADGFYYFVARSNSVFDKDKGFVHDKGFTKWSDIAGATGTKKIRFTLDDFNDYYLIWGIHKQGALSIDDIKVTESGERKRSEGSEDFETGDFATTLFSAGGGGGQIVSDAQEVVSGRFSAYGKADPSKSVWCEFLYSDKEELALDRKGAYTVTFKYKAVEAPGPDGFYYFLARSTAGGIPNDKAFTKWSDTSGATGTKSIEVTLGDFSDYQLIWGIHGQGALAIDDIRIVKHR